MKKQIGSHDFEEVYKWLGIDLNKLGCLMLDTEPIPCEYFLMHQDGVSAYFPSYHAKNKDRFWIDGYVGNKPHVTLLYGFLVEAKAIKSHIKSVLEGWKMDTVMIEDIGFFESPYADEPYYCIVAHLQVTDSLLEGHRRLELLPHINTFAGYKPHVTVAYIEKDEVIRDDFVCYLKKKLVGKELKVIGLNYGGNK